MRVQSLAMHMRYVKGYEGLGDTYLILTLAGKIRYSEGGTRGGEGGGGYTWWLTVFSKLLNCRRSSQCPA